MLAGFVLTLVRRMVVLEDAPWEAQLLLREVLHPTDACKTLVENYFRPQMEMLDEHPGSAVASRSIRSRGAARLPSVWSGNACSIASPATSWR